MPAVKKLFGRKADAREADRVLAQQPFPIFRDAAPKLKWSGKSVALYRSVMQVAGSWYSPAQDIGDCVGHGTTKAVQLTYAAEIASGEPEEWRGFFSTEVTYGGSRVEIGGGQLGANEDGSMGSWAADYVTKYGMVLRGKYGDYDLSEYNAKLAKSFGSPRKGVPDELDDIARETPVRVFTKITGGFEECAAAIENGYGIAISSMQGFEGMKRNRDGFMRPKGTWPHCMTYIAVIAEGNLTGLLEDNHWGENAHEGPKVKGMEDMPDSSFGVHAEDVDKNARKRDTEIYAFSDVLGFPAKQIPDFMFA